MITSLQHCWNNLKYRKKTPYTIIPQLLTDVVSPSHDSLAQLPQTVLIVLIKFLSYDSFMSLNRLNKFFFSFCHQTNIKYVSVRSLLSYTGLPPTKYLEASTRYHYFFLKKFHCVRRTYHQRKTTIPFYPSLHNSIFLTSRNVLLLSDTTTGINLYPSFPSSENPVHLCLDHYSFSYRYFLEHPTTFHPIISGPNSIYYYKNNHSILYNLDTSLSPCLNIQIYSPECLFVARPNKTYLFDINQQEIHTNIYNPPHYQIKSSSVFGNQVVSTLFHEFFPSANRISITDIRTNKLIRSIAVPPSLILPPTQCSYINKFLLYNTVLNTYYFCNSNFHFMNPCNTPIFGAYHKLVNNYLFLSSPPKQFTTSNDYKNMDLTIYSLSSNDLQYQHYAQSKTIFHNIRDFPPFHFNHYYLVYPSSHKEFFSDYSHLRYIDYSFPRYSSM